ncbi:hypothetical protein FDB55_03445 [Clostridium botulinum]|uniref:hypothetical protein n=1 Tax=Clostridium botulinum TaxID=1491 RepID=UPI0006A72EBD|nr:hypothetical protein [Clostridium botulinum]KAI3350146.1 hypothetical protein CIT18_04515 [Clostridium botulinum]KOM88960.1 hypothetical protein ACP51_04300 [Clostridium botulinum]KOR63526.1 hypothetical protein ADT22_03085 [Clostridium botulinum]MCS6111542.1 hypothetical protein [Clostridium botulinum]NFE10962.1 hypothetical protein [Clostridium botulinum]
MAIEIQGINNLINKLNKVSNIEAKEMIEEVAKDVETAIVNEVRTFSDTEYLYIGKCDVRDYGSSYFVDIGLKNDTVDFELWKGLWYHNWGYTHWKSGEMITAHVMWFDNAVTSIRNNVTNKIKYKIKQELNQFNK